MAKQRYDWRLAIVLIVASTIFVAAVLIVRRWQRNTQPGRESMARTTLTR